MALFRNDSPGALTMEQAIARHTAYLEKERRRIEAAQRTKAEAKTRAKKAAMAEQLAAEGRGHDTEVAHVTPGEMVIPHLFQTPEVLAALLKLAGLPPLPCTDGGCCALDLKPPQRIWKVTRAPY